MKLERIRNFRDFGGTPTSQGTRVVQGRLFRAAHPADATEADLRRIEALGIALVVDLRRPIERRREPGRIAASETVSLILDDLDDDQGDGREAPHVAFLRKGDISDAAARRFMLDFYENAADEPRHRAVFGEALAALSTLPGSVLVHCAAGKDRTGILVALIQTILGVPEDAILDEYLRTNAMMLTPERVAATTAYLRAQVGQTLGEAAVQLLLGVEAGFLTHALQAIAARHGSREAYLDGLGVDAGVRSQIRDRFTVAGSLD